MLNAFVFFVINSDYGTIHFPGCQPEEVDDWIPASLTQCSFCNLPLDKVTVSKNWNKKMFVFEPHVLTRILCLICIMGIGFQIYSD